MARRSSSSTTRSRTKWAGCPSGLAGREEFGDFWRQQPLLLGVPGSESLGHTSLIVPARPSISFSAMISRILRVRSKRPQTERSARLVRNQAPLGSGPLGPRSYRRAPPHNRLPAATKGQRANTVERRPSLLFRWRRPCRRRRTGRRVGTRALNLDSLLVRCFQRMASIMFRWFLEGRPVLPRSGGSNGANLSHM